MVHFCDLRLLQVQIGIWKIAAGVLHGFAIEPQLVKIVADVVMVMDVLFRPGSGICDPTMPEPENEAARATAVGTISINISVDRLQKQREIALESDLATAIKIAPVQFGVQNGFDHRTAIGIYNLGNWIFNRRRDVQSVPQPQRARRTANCIDHRARQPAIQPSHA